jgi:hypothetical protein
LPTTLIDKDKHGDKEKLKLSKGMLTIKWKKGMHQLGIGDDSENQSAVEKLEGANRRQSVLMKKEGYGKFQTYANFLKGEEKEQYEKYL